MKIVAVMACPVGAAHTYMSAEALGQELKKRNIEYKIETQGITGTDNEITEEDIKGVDGVILSDDVRIKGLERFDNLKIVYASTSEIIKQPSRYIDKILNVPDQSKEENKSSSEHKQSLWEKLGKALKKD